MRIMGCAEVQPIVGFYLSEDRKGIFVGCVKFGLHNLVNMPILSGYLSIDKDITICYN